jgi:hypothetical protein
MFENITVYFDVGRMGLYETQHCLGQSETLMLFFRKNKFKVRFIEK